MDRVRILFTFLLFYSCFGISFASNAPGTTDDKEVIRVRLYAGYKLRSIDFIHISGEYAVYADSIRLCESDKLFYLHFSVVGDSVLLQTPAYKVKAAVFNLIPLNEFSGFKIKSVDPNYKPRSYDDGLLVSADLNSLKLVNKVNIEKYVAGVLQWEVGVGNPDEFNKMKTIVCRTYALGNWRRHEDEDYQMCDRVHCQVFNGKTFHRNLHEAAQATAGYILVDDEARIITAAFFSNCGGQTMNSEDVWSNPVECLRSVPDSFCTKMSNAIWTKRIPKDFWLDYISNKFNYPVQDPERSKQVLHFDQPYRKVFLDEGGFNIPLKVIREDMKLKSTFFEISTNGNDMVFTGRGFGHGVGLCQEGAMQMAKLGYSYTRILNHYYSGVHLIRFSQLDFFRSE